MLNIVLAILLIVVIAGFVIKASKPSSSKERIANPNIWSKVLEVSSKVSGNSPAAKEYISLGKNDSDILGEESIFYNRASEEFGNNFIEWVQPDLEEGYIPCAVFKTVMAGLGYMGYLDWKDIYSAEEFIYSLDRVLKTHSLEVISAAEKAAISQELEKAEGDQALIARTNVERLQAAVDDRGYKILWFDEGGDSYAFFIVEPSVHSELLPVKLDSCHKFWQVKF